MAWDVEYTHAFGQWWEELGMEEQEALDASVRLLEERGPALGFPQSLFIKSVLDFINLPQAGAKPPWRAKTSTFSMFRLSYAVIHDRKSLFVSFLSTL